MRVNLSKMPDPKTLSAVTYDGLRGGLNLKDEPSRVGATQSPDMMNMWYRDGVLKKRSGQRAVGTELGAADLGQSYFYDKLFNGFLVCVHGGQFWYFDPDSPQNVTAIESEALAASHDSGAKHGTFFPFGEHLYYKAEGCYLRIAYEDGALVAEDLLWAGKYGTFNVNQGAVYTPIIAINRNPDGTGGTLYQPENRINPRKEIWFDIDDESHDYRLPVSGATVHGISFGDASFQDSEGFTSITILPPESSEEESNPLYPDLDDAGTISSSASDLPITSPLEIKVEEDNGATTLKFSTPLYTSSPAWSLTNQSYTSKVAAGDLGKNVVYSTQDVILPSIDTLTKYETVYSAADSSIPLTLSKSALDEAKKQNPYYSSYDAIMVLDNGQWCNFFFFKRKKLTEDPSIEDYIETYDSNTTEVVLKNYVMVTLRRPEWTWTVSDFRGKTDSGWHYLKNLTYADFTWDDPEIAFLPTVPSWLKIHYSFSIADYASVAMTEKYGTDPYPELLWISENEEYWVFHYTTSANTVPFRITSYDAEKGYFQAEGLTQVTVYKDYLTSGPVTKVMNDPGPYGYFVKNILWAGESLLYSDHIAGEAVIAASDTGGVVPEAYRKYAEIATFKAGSGATGNYFITSTSDGVVVYVEMTDSSKLEKYNQDTTEFSVSGYYRYEYTYLAEGTDISLVTPAATSNRLKVVYALANDEAMAAVCDCKVATSFGGSDAVCVVMGNCAAQPNAIFWSGNGSAGVDATYFPIDQYNLCGTYQDPVTAFGKQQNNLIVFQEHHISKASYGISTIGERKYIDLTLATINTERGCDMPWTVALCGNNLAWMHSKYGVLYLKSATSAYENMVVVISENVNGNAQRPGLLGSLKEATAETCLAIDDGERYLAFVGSDLYVWDYTIYAVSDGVNLLSWTRHQSFDVTAATEADTGTIWMLNSPGRVSVLDDSIDTDFGVLFPIQYATPFESFGGYYRLRNVEKIVMGIRSRNGGALMVNYQGEEDYGRQKIELDGSDLITPVVLKPRALRTRHFQVVLSSNGTDGGVELSSIVLYYSASGTTK